MSTTFGRVMAEREVFTNRKARCFFGVFGEFDLDHARLMMEVIFVNNNRNAFVVNEATWLASQDAGTLVMECHWTQPTRHKDSIIWTRQRKLVRFNELTIDQERQRAFYVDTEALEAQLQEEIDGPPLWKRFLRTSGSPTRHLRVGCAPMWTQSIASGRPAPEVRQERRPASSRHDFKFVGMVRSIFLAKLGRAVGWKYQQFWPAAHHVPDAEKTQPLAFR